MVPGIRINVWKEQRGERGVSRMFNQRYESASQLFAKSLPIKSLVTSPGSNPPMASLSTEGKSSKLIFRDLNKVGRSI